MKFLRFLKTNKVISIAIPMIILVGIVSVGIYAQSQNVKSNKVTHDIQISKATPVETKQSALPVPAATPASDPVTDQVDQQPTQSVAPTQIPTPEHTADTNPYAVGSSMYYVYNKRKEVGKFVGLWGSPGSWSYFARQAGLVVDLNPQPNDIVVISNNIVGFVEAVDENNVTYSYQEGKSITSPRGQFSPPNSAFIH